MGLLSGILESGSELKVKFGLIRRGRSKVKFWILPLEPHFQGQRKTSRK